MIKANLSVILGGSVVSKRVLLIVNPVAGKMRGKAALYPLTEAFCREGYEVTAFVTAARGDAERTARERAAGYDLVVCVGGDGTLGEVINGLMRCGAAVPLGYVPLGSTNDFAGTLGLPKRVPDAIRHVLQGTDVHFDVGLWNGTRYFSYIASFGAFTATSYNAPQSTKNVLGHFAYVLEGAKELSNIRSYAVTVETDERTFTGEYLFGAVSNSTTVGGMVKLNRELVDLHDGEFEVVLVKPPMRPRDLSRLLGALNSGNFDNDMFEFFKTPRVRFAIDGDPSWTLDGEQALGAPSITVENRADALLLRL